MLASVCLYYAGTIKKKSYKCVYQSSCNSFGIFFIGLDTVCRSVQLVRQKLFSLIDHCKLLIFAILSFVWYCIHKPSHIPTPPPRPPNEHLLVVFDEMHCACPPSLAYC